jgi:hypothetical protein
MIPQQSACTVSTVLVSSAVAGIGLSATGRVLLGRISGYLQQAGCCWAEYRAICNRQGAVGQNIVFPLVKEIPAIVGNPGVQCRV